MLLIDGYNLLFKYFDTASDTSIKKLRDKLISIISNYLGRKKKKAKIFFDSKAILPYSQKLSHKGLEVIFTKEGKSVDDEIIKFIRTSTDKSKFKVISSDKEVMKSARDLGCLVMSCEDFIQEVRKVTEKKLASGAVDKDKEQGISSAEAERWLKEFGLDDKIKL